MLVVLDLIILKLGAGRLRLDVPLPQLSRGRHGHRHRECRMVVDVDWSYKQRSLRWKKEKKAGREEVLTRIELRFRENSRAIFNVQHPARRHSWQCRLCNPIIPKSPRKLAAHGTWVQNSGHGLFDLLSASRVLPVIPTNTQNSAIPALSISSPSINKRQSSFPPRRQHPRPS